MTTDAENLKNLAQFQAEQMALQTKALQAIEKDTNVIQAVVSTFAVLVLIGMVVALIAAFSG